MSTYDLEEQEQLASLKSWWNDNSGIVLTSITVILLTIAGWGGWSTYQRTQATQAGSIYEQLQKAARANDVKATRDAAGAILEKFPSTVYAPLAAMVSAKIHYQTGDLKTALAQFQWALEHAASSEIKAIARLRLASVLVDDNSIDEAAKLLEDKPSQGFEALFAFSRGDIFMVQKKPSDARTSYKVALNSTDKLEPTMRELIQLKMDALGDF